MACLALHDPSAGPHRRILPCCTVLRQGRHTCTKTCPPGGSWLQGPAVPCTPFSPRPTCTVTPNPARRDKIDRSPRLKQQISFAAQWTLSANERTGGKESPPAGQDREYPPVVALRLGKSQDSFLNVVRWLGLVGRTDGWNSIPSILETRVLCYSTPPYCMHRDRLLTKRQPLSRKRGRQHPHTAMACSSFFLLFSSGLHSPRRGSEERGHRVCSGQDESRFKLTIKGLWDPLLPQVFEDHHPQVSCLPACLLASLNKLLLLLLLVPL